MFLALSLVFAQSISQSLPVPRSFVISELIRTVDGELVLLRDDKLFIPGRGTTVDMGFWPDSAQAGRDPGTILVRSEGNISVIEVHSGKSIAECKGLSAWVANGTVYVLAKSNEKAGIKWARKVPFSADVGVYCTGDQGNIIVGVYHIEERDEELLIYDAKGARRWMKLTDSNVWDWLTGTGSKALRGDTGEAWVLQPTSRSFRGLGQLYFADGDGARRWDPEALKAGYASIFCNDIWMIDGKVGALFYRFNEDESRQWFVTTDILKDRWSLLDEGISEVWPDGGDWYYLLPAAGSTEVLRRAPLDEFSTTDFARPRSALHLAG